MSRIGFASLHDRVGAGRGLWFPVATRKTGGGWYILRVGEGGCSPIFEPMREHGTISVRLMLHEARRASPKGGATLAVRGLCIVAGPGLC